MQIDGNKEPEEVQSAEPAKEEEIKNDPITDVNTTTKKSAYVGILEIPKIGLTKGFTSIDSKLNTVDRGLQVIKPSNYPDVEKGNFIIASHSGTSSISYFKNLYQVQINDIVNAYYNGKKYTYTIVNIYTQPKNGQIAIYRNYEATVITLVTCTKNDDTTQTVYIGELTSVADYKEV